MKENAEIMSKELKNGFFKNPFGYRKWAVPLGMFWNPARLLHDTFHVTVHRIIYLLRWQNFPKNEHFLPPDTHTFMCVSGGIKLHFFGKFCECNTWMIPIFNNTLDESLKDIRDSRTLKHFSILWKFLKHPVWYQFFYNNICG